ncbi:unnamed protein product, partial [Protopolystoma xenopodis]
MQITNLPKLSAGYKGPNCIRSSGIFVLLSHSASPAISLLIPTSPPSLLPRLSVWLSMSSPEVVVTLPTAGKLSRPVTGTAGDWYRPDGLRQQSLRIAATFLCNISAGKSAASRLGSSPLQQKRPDSPSEHDGANSELSSRPPPRTLYCLCEWHNDISNGNLTNEPPSKAHFRRQSVCPISPTLNISFYFIP